MFKLGYCAPATVDDLKPKFDSDPRHLPNCDSIVTNPALPPSQPQCQCRNWADPASHEFFDVSYCGPCFGQEGPGHTPHVIMYAPLACKPGVWKMTIEFTRGNETSNTDCPDPTPIGELDISAVVLGHFEQLISSPVELPSDSAGFGILGTNVGGAIVFTGVLGAIYSSFNCCEFQTDFLMAVDFSILRGHWAWDFKWYGHWDHDAA